MNAIKEIEKDTSISPEAKQKVISEVLNGCWFSGEPDKYYGKQKLVVRKLVKFIKLKVAQVSITTCAILFHRLRIIDKNKVKYRGLGVP